MIDVESLKWAALYLLMLLMYFFMIYFCFRIGGKAFLDSLNPECEFLHNPFEENSEAFNSMSPTLNRIHSFVIGAVLLMMGLFCLSYGVQTVINSLSKS